MKNISYCRGASPNNPILVATASSMDALNSKRFDVSAFLEGSGARPTTVRRRSKQLFFSQGLQANAVLYLQAGHARLTVNAKGGKAATVMLLGPGDFFGEESLAGTDGLYMASATAITDCTAIQIDREEMNHAMYHAHAFSVHFVTFLLARTIRVRADFVDQLFNSTEKRLARMLLLMADADQPGDHDVLLPRITQQILADLIGTTRSRVNLFMNGFRARGAIAYKGRIRINRLLLTSLLND